MVKGPMPGAEAMSRQGPDTSITEKGQHAPTTRVDDLSTPDGGRGWVVLAGCTIVSWWSIGTAQSFGVLQEALLKENVSTSVNLLFVGSLSASLVSAFAIFYARAMRAWGTRINAMLGISLMSLSGAISSVVYKDIGALFAAYGVLMGIGMGLTFTTVAVAPTQYFLHKRGLANGIVFAGGGAGGAVISVMMNSIIERLGLAWAFRIHCLLVAGTGLPAAFVIKERVPYKQSGLVDWKMFRSVSFALLFLVGALGTFPLFVPPYCVPTFASSLGLSSSTGASLTAAFNAASALGRIGSGLLCDRLGPLNVLFTALILLGASMFLIWPFASSLGPLIVFVIVAGITVGSFFSTMPTAVGHIFGSANMSLIMGMILTGWTGGYLMGPPIAGFILNANGGEDSGIGPYRPAMFFAGALALGSASLVAIIRSRRSPRFLTKI